jgi:putative component of membrane protein insertase Oxa1/YidC/SpoIIIJ protein YidD
LVSIGTPNVRSDWPPAAKAAYAEVARGLLDSIDDAAMEALVQNQVERIARCTCVSDFTAYRRIADPNSSSRHAELARIESFRDDGAKYDTGDAIEFVLYTSDACDGDKKPDVRWCLPQHMPQGARFAVSEYVRMFVDQAQPLISVAWGSERAARCMPSSAKKKDVRPSAAQHTAFYDVDF